MLFCPYKTLRICDSTFLEERNSGNEKNRKMALFRLVAPFLETRLGNHSTHSDTGSPLAKVKPETASHPPTTLSTLRDLGKHADTSRAWHCNKTSIAVQTRFHVCTAKFGSRQKQPARTPMQKQWVEAIMHGALDARKLLQV